MVITKKTKIFSVIVLMFFVTSILSGCVADPGASHTEKGVATGAGVGALAGAMWGLTTGKTENVVKGALIGAAAGAVIGGLVGWTMDYRERQTATYSQTQKRINYNPRQGTIVNIERLNARNQMIAPNSNLEIEGDYYIMAADAQKDITIKRVNAMDYYNTETKKYENFYSKEDEEVKKLGTNQIQNTVKLPNDAPDGNYQYVLSITADNKTDTKTLPFTVATKKGKRYIIFHNDNLYALNEILN